MGFSRQEYWSGVPLPSLDKGGRNTQWGKDSLFNKWCWKNWTATCKSEIRTLPNTYTKINSKWIKELNVRPETIELLEENIGRTLYDINQSKILCVPPLRGMEIKAKINKWDLIKLKSLCTTKETISKVKRQPLEWEKIIANETTDKVVLTNNFQNIQAARTRKTN